MILIMKLEKLKEDQNEHKSDFNVIKRPNIKQ